MTWFLIAQAKAGEPTGVAKITIDGEIGRSWWDDSAVASNDFMNAVKALGDVSEIHIDMNSPGGSVTDGLTIANYLRQHKARVVVNVLGQASSISSVIAAAADQVVMGLGAFMMVHQPWTVAVGNADVMRAMAADLDTINDGILECYVAKVGEDKRAEMEALVKGSDGDGTILSAEMAVALGLADSMDNDIKAAASVSALSHAMARAAAEATVLMAKDEVKPMTALDALALAFGIEASEVDPEDLAAQIQALREESGKAAATLDESIAALTLTTLQAKAPALVEAVLATADHGAAVSAERERVGTILKACETTGQFGHLAKLIDENWEASKASDYVLAAAAGSEAHIQGSHSPEGGQISGLDSSKIYARRNRKTTN